MKDSHSRSTRSIGRTFLLNVQFFPLFLLFTLVGVPVLTLFVAVAAIFISHRRAMGRFRRAISWYGWVIIRVLPFPWIRLEYRDLAPEAGPGPFLYVCNHRSLSDGFLMAVLSDEGVQIANIWPFRIPLIGQMARWAGYISINEISVDAFYEQAGRLLEEGMSIASFPEGTRSRSRRVGPFHSSVFRLALQCKTPIVPLCISGNERIPARGSLILHPGIIRMHRLPPITPEEYKDLSAFQLKTRVRDAIIRELSTMNGTVEDPGAAEEEVGPVEDGRGGGDSD